MNCPSRPDNIEGHPDWNQNPQALSSDLTTRADLNGIANQREQRDHGLGSHLDVQEEDRAWDTQTKRQENLYGSPPSKGPMQFSIDPIRQINLNNTISNMSTQLRESKRNPISLLLTELRRVLFRYAKFVGPGFMIAVAYIDPGNYATDVEAGATTQYSHLFIILMANLFAIFLQSLCIKLGSVTGLNLAENCRRHLPRWLTLVLYIFAESAIIATDIAEVGLAPFFYCFRKFRLIPSSLGNWFGHSPQPPAERSLSGRLCH